ncbi:acetyl-CoA C-acetyltransferase [Peribacillus castrilensis]|jgi:acetyl-CoA acyltransferase|uniref:acetyl-CoA C-acyltransferase n=2 Tax=Peribacillus TaxID=2675229 RepID=A0AA90P057_9BACI|nr:MULTISPECIES: acetyl-CoA C-acetyltransferase [Bacillaceae]KRF50683.1 acetyl-CoA acetyltransferase [Bacillus sp. Soil745]MCP1095710.1 acetyl-CoA C-acetyltransferase [Bacillaceae bacterium OS4b]MDP9738574.1 acetyl-CoA acyltransferase [Bacillus sp. B2I3]MEC0296857.1 acetyl-CoA C-acetyltransferase [Peribacillus castrilensis]PEO48536.1 acetyl-CoA C-acyltransferase [Bacillus sp. AFS026049]PRS37843.1 acetyl-CoA C-acyltransferase [Bacillus sp. RJGP41]QNK49333.1 acetyl-CoA C-acetyltransferase [Bre
MKEAVIVAGARTPVGRAKKGSLASVRPDDLGALVVKETLKRAGNYEGTIDDLIIGCAMPEAEQGLNMARNIGALAGLPYTVPAITINRYCSSGLQSIAYGAERIMLGQSDTVIAGGAESMSLLPMMGHVTRPNARLAETAPEYYMGMGHTAEAVAKKYGISRDDQDAFSVRSHQKAAKAIAEGKFSDEIVPVDVTLRSVGPDLKLKEKSFTFTQDEGVRPGTTAEVLKKLRPAFSVTGSVTAGNSSQTSDGAAAVMVMDGEKASSLGMKPMGKFRSFAVAGVPPEIMGIGPIAAIPKALKLAGLELSDIGLFELNEAFASQSIQIIRELGLNEEIVNVNGGAIALGHPLGCSGAKLTLSLLHEMKRRNQQFGVVTMCIGGGMGAAGVFELMA